ncbi:hypothetical protein F444_01266 [Phytophthora nicotianae P1976]|uniref:Uncharacterized protein n=1 Tax=Phytophthora nicotianae P1976 TaxID=1317066 RepID=A0A081B169_PHYNI|nr:hypothetical protein F444_01266 [Phytophthora nicotianae P1976]
MQLKLSYLVLENLMQFRPLQSKKQSVNEKLSTCASIVLFGSSPVSFVQILFLSMEVTIWPVLNNNDDNITCVATQLPRRCRHLWNIKPVRIEKEAYLLRLPTRKKMWTQCLDTEPHFRIREGLLLLSNLTWPTKKMKTLIT